MGKDRADLYWLLENIMPWTPRDKPVHVLGIADPESLPQLVTFGCDT